MPVSEGAVVLAREPLGDAPPIYTIQAHNRVTPEGRALRTDSPISGDEGA